jgi:hypothetical protein
MGGDYFGILIECTVTLFSIRKVKRRNDNSGVFIRFSDPGADASNAFKTGYEIQIKIWHCQMAKQNIKQVPFMISFLMLLWLQNR